MSEKFDFNEALAALQSGQDLTGKDGILTPLIKQFTEAALKAELESHLEEDVSPNRKNALSPNPMALNEFHLAPLPCVTCWGGGDAPI